MSGSQAGHVPLFKVFLPPEDALLPRIRDVLYSGHISEGEPVYDFERRFGGFIGQESVLSFYSGTAALHTALILAGVERGDEVISTPMTAEPTNMAILHAGGRIVWADVDPLSGNISADSIKDRISERTKAIMVVHYGGVPAAIGAIQEIAAAYGVPIIEDAAHALGARYGGEPIGSHSHYVVFSFQAIKHMTTVDGGMLVCRNPDDIPRAREIRWFGMDRAASRTEADVTRVGFKYHMNNVNATIGAVQLEHIRPVLERHIENGKFFDSTLRGISGVRLCAWDTEAEPSYWFYTILAETRDDLATHLRNHGIESSTVHRRNDLHSVFSASRTELPDLDWFYRRVLHIPCGWWVSDDDRERIVELLRMVW
jgi:dTDP-4-amino-4,6-dideoxygalactose transaminase